MQATDTPAKTRVLIPPERELNQKLYMPIILEKALSSVCDSREPAHSTPSALENEAQLDEEQAFHSFVNKLAQVCDNRPRGKTVTALAILDDAGVPEYVVASNERNKPREEDKKDELEETHDFLSDLLSLVGKNPDRLRPKPLEKQVLWKILLFNAFKVDRYLDILERNLTSCIEDCDEKRLQTGDEAEKIEFREWQRELETIKQKTEFERNVMDENKKVRFLKDCETLIKAIVAITGRSIEKEIKRRNRNEANRDKSKPWCELRHYFGRMLAFRSAAETITRAANNWRELFETPKVTIVPSSTRDKHPFSKAQQRTMTAVDIISAMEEDSEPLIWQANKLQALGLNEQIRDIASKGTFKPLVHAEILVHDYLLSLDITHPRDYWAGWKYIGSSKPTCRLCWYYFLEHPDNNVQVRSSHSNVYPAWRLPDVYEDQGEIGGQSQRGAVDQRHRLVEAITARIWGDARKTMTERLGRKKDHDSNTYSGVHPYLRHGDRDGDDDDDGVSTSNSNESLSASHSSETAGTSEGEFVDAVGDQMSSAKEGVSTDPSSMTPADTAMAQRSEDEDDEEEGGVLLRPTADLGIY